MIILSQNSKLHNRTLDTMSFNTFKQSVLQYSVYGQNILLSLYNRGKKAPKDKI